MHCSFLDRENSTNFTFESLFVNYIKKTSFKYEIICFPETLLESENSSKLTFKKSSAARSFKEQMLT